MQNHNLIPRTKSKKTMIVGRGGRRGKTSGRGGKGQTARAGNKRRPELRDFIKRIPKLRGRGISPLKSIGTKPFIISLQALDKIFKDGDVVSRETLIKIKGMTTFEGRTPQVKILGTGEITKKITVEGCQVSKSAKIKIEKAGGTVK